MVMKIIVVPCECGHTFYAKVDGGVMWVEAEKMDDREVNAEIEKSLIERVGALKKTEAMNATEN